MPEGGTGPAEPSGAPRCDDVRVSGADSTVKLYEDAESGDVAAMVQLAVRLWPDDDVETDWHEEAVRWLRRAADAGDVRAMVHLGFRLWPEADADDARLEEARKWLRQAAETGDVDAAQAEHWYLRADEAGREAAR